MNTSSEQEEASSGPDGSATHAFVTAPARAPAPTAVSSPPGYEALEKLGQGGMGVVYKARQIKLGRLVALKMVLAGSHADENELARFKTEAETVARLNHPHIVQIYDVGEHQGLPFLCLEYVEGGCLRGRFDGKPWQPRLAAELVEIMARAVQAAHEAGIVHRDLKPANVLLTAEGEPKIADFGLARLLDHASERTRTGTIMGTPGYMAPEQALGHSKEVGPAADIFSLGAILYQALTGKPPFEGPTHFATLRLTVDQEVERPSIQNPEVDRDLEAICLKCLEKTPEQRYASALGLADDLRRWLSGQPVEARLPGTWEWLVRWMKGQMITTAAVLFLLFSLLLTAFNLYWSDGILRFYTGVPGPGLIRRSWLPILFFLFLGFVGAGWGLAALLVPRRASGPSSLWGQVIWWGLFLLPGIVFLAIVLSAFFALAPVR
jgi:tRNA A-37 threonylcarbamoyl transferase component Bud32